MYYIKKKKNSKKPNLKKDKNVKMKMKIMKNIIINQLKKKVKI